MIKYFLIFISITVVALPLESAYTVEFDVTENGDEVLEIVDDEESNDLENKVVITLDRRINSPKDITIFTKKDIEPINYTNTVSLDKLEVSEKKKKFFHMMLPAILISKQKLKAQRARANRILHTVNPTEEELLFLDTLYKKYRTNDGDELLSRMKTHPVSIVLAQAAIESGWGESRFFKKGNNVFGIWSFDKNEPRMRARETRNGKPVYLKKYASLSEAIDDYFVTIGRGAYESFRRHRDITKDPLELVRYLINYCELREKYTRKLRRFIIVNNLRDFDKFRIDENYLTRHF